MQEIRRTRKDVWEVIGIVGGYHDGLGLIASLLFSPLAGILFQRDLVQGSFRDTKSSLGSKMARNKLSKSLEYDKETVSRMDQ